MERHNAQLQAKLEAVEAQLAEDLADADRTSISHCFEQAVAELLPGARITDFLPVLTYRHARACVTAA